MLAKVLLALASALLGSHSGEENGPFQATAYGPQSMSEAHLAHIALHGGHDEMLKNPSGASIRDKRTRWPGYPGRAEIAYTIDRSLDFMKDLILQAMNEYHRNTCIRFKERTNETDFVRIIRGVGCFSFVGRIGGLQVLSLGRGCGYIGTIVHELGHAVGFYHEHQRSDRDEYITVYKSHIKKGVEHNFLKTNPSEEVIFTPYDYRSVMHYGEFAFSRNPGVEKTMEAKRRVHLVEPYDKPGLSESDVVRANRLYECGIH